MTIEETLQDPRFQGLGFEEQKKAIDSMLEEERAGAGGKALTSKAGVEEYGGPLNIPASWETVKEIGKASALPIAGGIIGGAPGAMAGEFLSQEFGLAPKSLSQMLLAGLPEPAAIGAGIVRRVIPQAAARTHPELMTALREEAAAKGGAGLRAARPPGGPTPEIEKALQATPEAATLARAKAVDKLQALVDATVAVEGAGPGLQSEALAAKILHAYAKDPELQAIQPGEIAALTQQLQGMAGKQGQTVLSPPQALAGAGKAISALQPSTPAKTLYEQLRSQPEYAGKRTVTTQQPGPPSPLLQPSGEPFTTTQTVTSEVPNFPVETTNLQALAGQQADIAATLGQYVRRVGAVSTELQPGMPALGTFEDLHNLQRWASEALDGAEGIERGKLLQIRRAGWQDLDAAALTPELKAANATFAKEQGVETLQRMARQATTADQQGIPGLNTKGLLTAYDRRLADDELFSRAFDPKEHQQLRGELAKIAGEQSQALLSPQDALSQAEGAIRALHPAGTTGEAEAALGKTTLAQNLASSQVMDKVEKAFQQSMQSTGGIAGLNADAFLTRLGRMRRLDPTLSVIPEERWGEMIAPFVEMATEQKKYKSGVGTLALPGMISQLGGFAGYQAGGLPGALLGAGVGLATYGAGRGMQTQRALSNPAARASLLQNLRAQTPTGAPWKTAIPLQVLAQSPEVILRSLNQGQAAPGLLPEEERLRQP